MPVTMLVSNETTSIEIKLGNISTGISKIKNGSKNKNPRAYNNKTSIDAKMIPDNTRYETCEKSGKPEWCAGNY